MLQLLLLFVPIAFLLGWFWGQYGAPRHSSIQDKDNQQLSPEYLWGLNYLINEHTDQALEMLVKLVELNQETSELHLSLGRLFRKRGELDRALAIHQHLAQYPSLSPLLRAKVELELARDYLSVSVFDRAEKLLRELVKRRELVEESLSELLYLYKQRHAWKKVLATIGYLSKWSGQDLSKTTAYAYCELAKQALEENKPAKIAFSYLKRALSAHHENIYARYIAIDFYLSNAHFDKAWQCIKTIIEHDSTFALPLMPAIEKCCKQSKDLQEQWVAFLTDDAVILPIDCYIKQLELLVRHIGVAATIKLLTTKAQGDRLPYAMLYLLRLHLAHNVPVEREELSEIEGILTELCRDHPAFEYYCEKCGFVCGTELWCCPHCHNWEGLKPRVLSPWKSAS